MLPMTAQAEPDDQDVGYIVIENYSSQGDSNLGPAFNAGSGLTNFSFLVLMKATADDLQMSVVTQMDDTLVLRGTQAQLRKLRSENGERFSYAFVAPDDLAEFMDSGVDFSQAPKEDGFESDDLNFGEAPPQRFDA